MLFLVVLSFHAFKCYLFRHVVLFFQFVDCLKDVHTVDIHRYFQPS